MPYTTPSTWVAGAVLTAAQLNQQLRDNLLQAFPLGVDAWTSYTPTLTQPGAITKTVTYAKYQRVGRLIHATIRLAVTGAGTAPNPILVGLPVTAADLNSVVGAGQFYDASATARYSLTVIGNTTSTVLFIHDTSGANPFGTAPVLALASGDDIHFNVTYEAAT